MLIPNTHYTVLWLIPVCDKLITMLPPGSDLHTGCSAALSTGVCLQVLEMSSTPSLKPARIIQLYVAPPFLCWYSHSSSCIHEGMCKLWGIVLGHNIMNLSTQHFEAVTADLMISDDAGWIGKWRCSGMLLKAYILFISLMFHLIWTNCVWSQVTNTLKRGIEDNMEASTENSITNTLYLHNFNCLHVFKYFKLFLSVRFSKM